jgi:hypothetical protein
MTLTRAQLAALTALRVEDVCHAVKSSSSAFHVYREA